MKKESGSVADLMATGICILAMTVVMMAYMDSVELLHRKAEVSQLARKYILRMETVGYLVPRDRTAMCQELSDVGVTEIDLGDTSLHGVSYGQPITLHIRGKLKGEYVFEEKRMSTAKN